MSKLDIHYKKGVYLSFDIFGYSIHPAWYCLFSRTGLKEGGGGSGVLNRENLLSVMKVVYWWYILMII